MGTRIQVMPSAVPDATKQQGVLGSTSTQRLTIIVGPNRASWLEDPAKKTLSPELLKVCCARGGSRQVLSFV